MTPNSATKPSGDPTADKNAIRPFQVDVPAAELIELRRRIGATRWPERETVTDESQGVLISVQDSGPGLDPQSLDHLFEAFYTTKPHGLGMGLAISRSLIEAHGGRLWATTNAPRGAVFQFTLPTGGQGVS